MIGGGAPDRAVGSLGHLGYLTIRIHDPTREIGHPIQLVIPRRYGCMAVVALAFTNAASPNFLLSSVGILLTFLKPVKSLKRFSTKKTEPGKALSVSSAIIHHPLHHPLGGVSSKHGDVF